MGESGAQEFLGFLQIYAEIYRLGLASESLPLSGSRDSRNSHAYFACLELLAGIQLPTEDQQQVYSEGKCC